MCREKRGRDTEVGLMISWGLKLGRAFREVKLGGGRTCIEIKFYLYVKCKYICTKIGTPVIINHDNQII